MVQVDVLDEKIDIRCLHVVIRTARPSDHLFVAERAPAICILATMADGIALAVGAVELLTKVALEVLEGLVRASSDAFESGTKQAKAV